MADLRAVFTLAGPDLPIDRAEVGTETFTIGRAPNNGLQLNNSRVSRHHADITYAFGQFMIEDLDSANGTYINDMRIETKKPTPIRPGDILRIGPFTLTFERIAEEAAPQKAKPVPEPVGEPPSEQRPPGGDGATPKVEAVPPSKPAEPPAQEAPPAPAVYVSQPPGQPVTVQPQPTQPSPGRAEPATGPVIEPAAIDWELVKPTYPPSTNGHRVLAPYIPIEGVPVDGSRYIQYLPGVFSDSDFLKRYLLIMESMLAPLEWGIDSFEQYYNPFVTTPDWLQWIGSWFDVLIHPSVPIERQRAVVKELGKLFRQRGTRRGLTRLLELYFGVKAEIEELDNPPATFKVKLPLGKEDTPLNRSLAARLITTYKPAHTEFSVDYS